MQQERAQLHEETQRLREEIQLLNSAIKWDLNLCSISNCIRTVKQLKPFIYGREGLEILFFSVFFFSIHLSLQCVSAAASSHRCPHHTAALWPHEAEVQGVRSSPNAAELEVLDRILIRHRSGWPKYNLHPSLFVFFVFFSNLPGLF